MKICFHFPFLKNSQSNSLFKDMYTSFFKGLEQCNFEVMLTYDIEKIEGDVLVLIIGGGYEKIAARAMHQFKGPVVLYVYNAYLTFYKSFLKRWNDRIIFAYNPDYAILNFKKYSSVGIPYFHFPFGSDESVFHPINTEKTYDIAFLGNANSGTGRDKYVRPLMKYVKENKLKIFLAGSGWEKFGLENRTVESGSATNAIYNASKICINIHNDRQFLGENIEMDANNRLFDLAMTGCCQVSNGEKMIQKYFNKNEIAAADDPKNWLQLIDYYLNNETKRIDLGQNAHKRALEEHTWNLRAAYFKELINNNIVSFNTKAHKRSKLTMILRYFDQYLIPPYQLKEIRIIRFFLKKLNLYTK